jgi:hypothetical protein
MLSQNGGLWGSTPSSLASAFPIRVWEPLLGCP